MFRNRNRKMYKGKFDLSHEFKFTCDMGKLIPVNCVEVVPGDKFKGANQAIVKLQALLAPVMHDVNIYFRSFYVPNRIIWKNWDEFITGGKDGNSAPVKPFVKLKNVQKSSLFDYLFGVPTGINADCKVDALPLRAYNLIVNEYFQDQQLDEPLKVNVDNDGEDSVDDYSLQNVNWEKDYFTSARPSPQAGSGAIMPLGDSAPVVGDGKVLGLTNGERNFGLIENENQLTLAGSGSAYGTDVGAPNRSATTAPNQYGVGVTDDPKKSGLKADLSNASPVSIEMLRNAFKVQSYLEKLNTAGHHMVDWLRAFFGVRASDARLNRPEYLGGGKQPLFFSEVLQTSETGTTPLGTQAGHSTSFATSKVWKKFVEEHGWIMTLMYIRPRTGYMQGINRQFTRETKFDYYLPEFATLGEQAIKQKELYFTGDSTKDEKTFGYATRYQEMRSCENRVAGEFRDTLKYWHMAREFSNEPVLNNEIISCNPTKRIYATEGESNQVLVQCANYLHAVRPIPKFVTPATLN